jgi:hypothetical protein
LEASRASAPRRSPKAGICVSTVSTVCAVTDTCPEVEHGPSPYQTGLSPVVAGRCGAACTDPRAVVPHAADDADGADAIFGNSTHPDNPVSSFATESNLDAQCPQEGLRATQAARQRAGILGRPHLEATQSRRCPSAIMSTMRGYHGVRPRYSVTVIRPSFAYSPAPNMLAGPRH